MQSIKDFSANGLWKPAGGPLLKALCSGTHLFRWAIGSDDASRTRFVSRVYCEIAHTRVALHHAMKPTFNEPAAQNLLLLV
jgi:hypothetical protein